MDKSVEIKTDFILKAMGNASFDLEKFKKTETYRKISKNMSLYCTAASEDAPEVLSYWEEMGMQKELHEADRGGRKWASYMPVDLQPGEKRPLLFVLHGSNNPIFLAETYGYVHIAARERLIVIMPEDESEKRIDELFAFAKENYPVDWSRVYMVGFSLGGLMTSRHAFRWPERFAAVGWGGMLFANGTMDEFPHMGEIWPAETLTPERAEEIADIELPIIDIMGENEMIDVMPATKDLIAEGPYDSIYFKGSNKIASINNIRRIAGCAPISEEEVRSAVAAAADIAVEKLGYPFEKTEVFTRGGRTHYAGYCVAADGQSRAKFICVKDTPHWPSQDHADLVWEFISQYARDPETKKLIRR